MSNRAAQLRNENSQYAISRRGRNYIEFDLGNGTKRLVSTIEPLHYGASTNQEIDTTWQTTTGAWQWMVEANSFHLYSRSVLNAGDTVQWLDVATGENVTLQPLALNWVNENNSRQQITQPQAVTASASDATLTWTNGYGTGRHFRYTAHPRKLIKEFIVDSAANLPAPTVTGTVYLEVEFILKRSNGVTLYVDGQPWDNSTQLMTANEIQFRTAANQVVWKFEKPSATDSSGSTVVGLMQLRRQGNNRFVTVRFPKTWIDQAIYPIYLDPTLTLQPDSTDGIDTQVRENAGTTNYGNSATSNLEDNTNLRRFLLYKFDLSPASGGTVTSATFTVWNDNTISATTTPDLYLINNANSGWNESATWNTKDGTNAWAGDTGANGGSDAGCSVLGTDTNSTPVGTFTYIGSTDPGTAHPATLDTTQVQSWVNGNYAGILMRDADLPAMRMCEFFEAETRPLLVIEYTTGGSPATINLDTATLSVTGQTLSLVKGAVSPQLSTATLSITGQALTLQKGPVSVSLDTATLSLAGLLLDVLPGAVSISLDTAALLLSALAVDATTPVTIQLDPASLSITGQSLTPIPGAVSLTLDTATLTISSQLLDVQPGEATISLDAATLNASGQPLSISVGPVSILLDPAVITLIAHQLAVEEGAVTISLDLANLIATGQTISVDVGGVPPTTISLNLATIIVTGQALDVQPGAVSIAVATATVNATGQTIVIIAPIPGTTVNLDTATSIITGQPISINVGGVSVPLDVANLLVTGENISILPGGVSISLDTATLLSNAYALDLILDAVTILLKQAELLAVAQPLDVVPGAVTTVLDTAVITSTGWSIRHFDTTSKITSIVFSLKSRSTIFTLSTRSATKEITVRDMDIE